MLRRLFERFRRACPECGQNALQKKDFIRASCVDEHGQAYPDHWSYHLCTSCGSKLKLRSNGSFEVTSEEEWAVCDAKNRENR